MTDTEFDDLCKEIKDTARKLEKLQRKYKEQTGKRLIVCSK